MQYPQIQFYRGSLVRLASGKLKQVEDLSSEDFLESARLTTAIDHMMDTDHQHSPMQLDQHEPNHSLNLSVGHRHSQGHHGHNHHHHHHHRPNLCSDEDDCEDDEDEELDVINLETSPGTSKPNTYNSTGSIARGSSASSSSSSSTFNVNMSTPVAGPSSGGAQFSSSALDDDDAYVDSIVVRDFLEVGPSSSHSPSLSASTSSLPTHNQHFQQTHQNLDHQQHHLNIGNINTNNLNQHQFLQHHPQHQYLNQHYHNSSPSSSCPQTPSPNSLSGSYLMLGPQSYSQNHTVLIKFFLESTRSIVFCEVPIEQPFFVYYRGWSSWNPQRTYDKFGLKCRKLKIGDTCLSRIRRRDSQQDKIGNKPRAQKQESDRCNIMFSSIKLH